MCLTVCVCVCVCVCVRTHVGDVQLVVEDEGHHSGRPPRHFLLQLLHALTQLLVLGRQLVERHPLVEGGEMRGRDGEKRGKRERKKSIDQ